jgi:chemotaxis protein MotB
MAREKKTPPEDDMPGAPEWMVTFSDCMTLLLTFFVLLLSFSSFDDRIFKKLRVIYSDAFPTVHARMQSSREALMEIESIRFDEDIDQGSEKKTDEDGQQGSLLETHEKDHLKHKVFLFNSDEFFWGDGTFLSKQGRENLALLARFLNDTPSAVVISENGDEQSNSDLGMSRSWEVVKYLTNECGMDVDRFSLSAASAIGQENFELFDMGQSQGNETRTLEILLLQWSLKD